MNENQKPKKLPQRLPDQDKESYWVYRASGGDPEQAEYIKREWPLSKVVLWFWMSTL